MNSSQRSFTIWTALLVVSVHRRISLVGIPNLDIAAQMQLFIVLSKAKFQSVR